MAETRNRNVSGSSLLCYDITLPVPLPSSCGVLQSSSKPNKTITDDHVNRFQFKATSDENFWSRCNKNGSLIDIPIVQPNFTASNFQFQFPQSVTLLPEPTQELVKDHTNYFEYSTVLENDEEDEDLELSTYQRMYEVDLEETVIRKQSSSSSIASSKSLESKESFPRCCSFSSGCSEEEWEDMELNRLIANQDSTYTDRLLEKIKFKINKVESGGTCEFEDGGGTPLRFSKHNQQAKNEEKQFTYANEWKELGERLRQQFHWNLEEMHKIDSKFDLFENSTGDEENCEENGTVYFQSNPNENISDVMSKVMGITKNQVKQLDFIHDSVFKASKIALGDSHLQEISKYLAFSCYQEGDMQRCGYYLTESHNAFIKMDICDSHNLYMSRIAEMWNPPGTSDSAELLERQKQTIHMLQNEALMKYGNSFAGFQRQTQYLYRNWNTIQITADSHCFNRFGEELADLKEMPGIWITSFAPSKCGEVRSFTVHIKKQPGNTMEENFTRLIAANKEVSEGHIEDRKIYWKTRFGHNQQLREFLANIEEWIGPYMILFPGFVKSAETRQKYWNIVNKIEDMCGTVLPESTMILLYKLVENFEFFPNPDFLLKRFLTRVLNIASNKVIDNIVKVLTVSWRKINSDCNGNLPKRHETILVLDSELERYPWDWLPVFQKTKTAVTRMLSMSHIYASIKVTKEFIVKFPRFVEPKRGMFVLNPDKSLESVQQRLHGYLSARGWIGVAGENPTFEEFEHGIQQCHVMLYCGHGSGCTIYPDWALSKLLCRSVPILMGCSSAQPRYISAKTYQTSVINSYVTAVCPSIVGFLWEITDVECDRVTIDFLERWLPCPQGMASIPPIPNFDPNLPRPKEICLTSAVLKSKYSATQFMTEAAVVVYGLPVYTINTE